MHVFAFRIKDHVTPKTTADDQQLTEDDLIKAYTLPLDKKNRKRLFKSAVLKECKTSDYSTLTLKENCDISAELITMITRLFKKYEAPECVYSINNNTASLTIDIASPVRGHKVLLLDLEKNCVVVTLTDGHKAESHSTAFSGDISGYQAYLRALRAYVCPKAASSSCERLVDAKKHLAMCRQCYYLTNKRENRKKKHLQENAIELLNKNLEDISPAFKEHVGNQLKRKESGRFAPYNKR